MSGLSRFGVSINKDLLEKFDEMIAGTYENRSEAIRDLIREKIIAQEWENKQEEVIATLTLLYDHHQRQLTEKMLEIQHDYHHLFKSNLHVHVSHDYCLEVIIIQGVVEKVQQLSQRLIGLKGVKHGKLTIASTGEKFNSC